MRASSFASMREIEERDIREQNVGIFYKPYLGDAIQSGMRFMRQGRAGGFATELSAAQRKRLYDTFGEQMQALGYGD